MFKEENVDELVHLTNEINYLKYDLKYLKKVKTINSIVIGHYGDLYNCAKDNIGVGVVQRSAFSKYIDIGIIRKLVAKRINDKLKIAIEKRDKLIK